MPQAGGGHGDSQNDWWNSDRGIQYLAQDNRYEPYQAQAGADQHGDRYGVPADPYLPQDGYHPFQPDGYGAPVDPYQPPGEQYDPAVPDQYHHYGVDGYWNEQAAARRQDAAAEPAIDGAPDALGANSSPGPAPVEIDRRDRSASELSPLSRGLGQRLLRFGALPLVGALAVGLLLVLGTVWLRWPQEDGNASPGTPKASAAASASPSSTPIEPEIAPAPDPGSIPTVSATPSVRVTTPTPTRTPSRTPSATPSRTRVAPPPVVTTSPTATPTISATPSVTASATATP